MSSAAGGCCTSPRCTRRRSVESCSRRPGPGVDELALDGGEEGLSHGIVPALALPPRPRAPRRWLRASSAKSRLVYSAEFNWSMQHQLVEVRRRCSLKASAGVFHPRVLRGRLFSGDGDGLELLCGPTGQVGSLREVLAEQSVGVLVRAALPWLCGSAKKTGMPGLDLELACGTSPCPRSHVSDRRSCSGSVVIWLASAFFIVIAP